MSADDPAQVLEVHDPATGLHGRLRVILGTDGGVAAARVTLRNDAGGTVVLRHHADPDHFLFRTATDRRGEWLTPLPPLPASSSVGPPEERTLRPGESIGWELSMNDLIGRPDRESDPVPGRLWVIATVDVRPVSDADGWVDATLTMYDMDVRFTSRAAGEGTRDERGDAGA